MSQKFPSGVLTGDAVQAVFNDAQDNEYALPAVNVVGTNSVNAVLETAAAVNSPVMIQFSNGGGIYSMPGKVCQMKVRLLLLPAQFREQSMFMLWPKAMECL